jgi:hypothetical protein
MTEGTIFTLSGHEITVGTEKSRQHLVAAVIRETMRAGEVLVPRLPVEEAEAELRMIMSTETAYLAGQLAAIDPSYCDGDYSFIALVREVRGVFNRLMERAFDISNAQNN